MLGKDNTKAWLWRQNYSYQANKGAVFGTNEQNPVGMGLKMGAAPNADVHWDKSYKFNFGIDTRFLNGRLSFGLDAYLDKEYRNVSSKRRIGSCDHWWRIGS